MKEPKLRFKADDGAKFPDWEKNNFSDVFDSINNSTFSRDCLNYVDGNVKYIHYGDILTTFDSTVNVEASDVPYVNKDIDCQKYQLLADGDIIVADTAEDDTVGKAVEIVNVSNVKVISGLHTIACRPKLKFTSGYLGYYMNSNSYHNQLHPYMQGIKVTSISKANIALTNISIPSLPEQQKIASLFSELDTLIQSAEKELEGYRELKQCMLQKMFPKKGEKVPEIRFPEFTGDWEQRKLKDISSLITKGTTPKDKSGTGEVNFIKVENINDFSGDITGTSKISLEEHQGYLKRSQLQEGDILFSIAGTLGRVTSVNKAILPANTNQALSIIRLKEGNLEYVKTCLKGNVVADFIRRNPTIGAQPNLSLEQVSNLEIEMPSEAEQKKIGEYFQNLDSLIASQQQELDGYKELKKGLLQQMFC